MRTRNDDINQSININLMSLNSRPQSQQQRELALSERPLVWLVERHAELMNFDVCSVCGPTCPGGCDDDLAARGDGARFVPTEVRLELESIEDEIIDRDEQGDLEHLERLDNSLWERAQQIIQRGSNR
jgi:hypothetical protein